MRNVTHDRDSVQAPIEDRRSDFRSTGLPDELDDAEERAAERAMREHWNTCGDSIRDRLQDAEQLGHEGKFYRQNAIVSLINEEVAQAGRDAVQKYRERAGAR